MNTTNEAEKDIKTVLANAEGGADYELDREEGLRDMLVGSFRGRARWMTVVAWVDSIVFTAIAVFAAVRFFAVEDVRGMILYATIFLTAGMIIMLVKLWFWLLFNRNSLKREIKRLELRVAELVRTARTPAGGN